jgi:hypothetical protein
VNRSSFDVKWQLPCITGKAAEERHPRERARINVVSCEKQWPKLLVVSAKKEE